MESQHFGYEWKILAMSYVCQLAFALVFQSIPPVLSLIIPELNITHAQAGLLMSLFALPGIIIAIPSGIISDRFGMKKVGVASLILMIIGTLILGISTQFLPMCVGRTISGIGALTLSIVLPQLVSRWFTGKKLGIGMGIFNTAMPLGTITSFNAFSIIAKNYGWQAPILITTTASTIALLIFLWLFKEPPLKIKETKHNITSDMAKVGLPIWLVGFAWMWFNASFISFLTFSQNFFISKGYEIGFAGFMSSTLMMGSLFFSPLIGYFVYKFGKEKMLIVLGDIVLAFSIFLVPTAPSPIPILLLMATFVAFIPTPIFSLPSKLVQPKNLGLGFGIFTACGNAGALAGPYLTGLAKDLTSGYTASFHLMSLFATLQAVTTIILHFTKPKQNPSPCIGELKNNESSKHLSAF